MNYIREATEILLNYRNLKVAVKNLEDKITKLTVELNSVKPIDYSGMPKGNYNCEPDDCIFNNIFQLDQCKINIEETKKTISDIDNILKNLDNEYRQVLTLWYIEEKTCEEMKNILHCSKSQLYRIKGAAIKQLAIQLFGIKVIRVAS